ncbi:hypothetical protein [Halorhodospira halophila]|uniref:hypothetical protein n=1 Tax=Halorhodospira halophila TaxID=1053 RepID=UPI001913E003|nr:hypothetical protein [Halorhodospira halophila]MBK5935701.1 hypothetical protein [Halorhodospira halophila]
MKTDNITLQGIAEATRARLAKDQPDYHGITSELLGAKRMALALGDHRAAALADQLHSETVAAWRAAA